MSLLFRVLAAAHANGTHHKLALNALEQLAVAGRRGLASPVPGCMPNPTWRGRKLRTTSSRTSRITFCIRATATGEARQSSRANVVSTARLRLWGKPESGARVVLGQRACSATTSPTRCIPSTPRNRMRRATSTGRSNGASASAFDSLYADASARSPQTPVTLGEGPKQLKALMCANADRSNAHYELLIAHYDIKVGISDPPSGLDPVARRIVGALLVEATATVAAVLDRAITAASVAPPQVGLTLATVVATLRIPRKLMEKRLSNAEDRRIVSAMYDELMATGSRRRQPAGRRPRGARPLRRRDPGAAAYTASRGACSPRRSHGGADLLRPCVRSPRSLRGLHWASAWPRQPVVQTGCPAYPLARGRLHSRRRFRIQTPRDPIRRACPHRMCPR